MLNKLINWFTDKYIQLEDYIYGYVQLKKEAEEAERRAELAILNVFNSHKGGK